MITRLASLSIGARLTAVTGRCRYGEARLSRPIIGQRVPSPLFKKELGMTTTAEADGGDGVWDQVWGLSMLAQAELDNGDIDGALKTLVRIAEVASQQAVTRKPK